MGDTLWDRYHYYKYHMTGKYVWILILLVAFSDAVPLKQSKVIKAVNCGLKEGYTKSDDIKFESV